MVKFNKDQSRIISVLVLGPFNQTYYYFVEKESTIEVGQIVSIPFGKQENLGVVVDRDVNNVKLNKIKKITDLINLPLLDIYYLDFINFFSNWNCIPKGIVLKMILSPFDKSSLKKINLSKYEIKDEKIFGLGKERNFKKLNSYQKNASDKILNSLNTTQSKCFLLEGVAGSGKTETYFEAVKKCIMNKKQVLILLPEIGLTLDWESRFFDRFGFKPLIWHSGISKNIKKKIWLSALQKKNMILVGTRSALFIPFKNLGLIVIDEEHDVSFKQEEGTRYHARDMAIYLASKMKIPVILSSATPSIETKFNAKNKKFSLLNLPARATGSDLPEIRIIDLKKYPPRKNSWLSEIMLSELDARYKNNEQSLIFLNRRGYSALTLCKNCGFKIHCKNCNAWLVEHKKNEIYLCHHCGYVEKVFKSCKNCGESKLVSCGPGIEKITEEIKNNFPNAFVEVFSSDILNNFKKFDNSLKKIMEGKVDFIIGTQIIAKGYDLKNLNFVGIVDGDIGTYGGDLRSSERCFQLLTQVSGRAGRHLLHKKGLVHIQTYNPENIVLKTIKEMNKERFFEEELNFRRKASMPPFSRLVSIIISSKYKLNLEKFSIDLKSISPEYKEVEILGPAPAPLFFLRGRYRIRFLIR